MGRLRVLTVYEAYLNRGGEDEVFEAEADLLERHGHEVHRFRIEADELREPSLLKRVQLAAATVWSQRYYRQFRRLVRDLRPDVVHFHNTFPLLSPSVYTACRKEGVAVVQTLHNYRMVCPKSTFFREGGPCEDCLGRSFAWPAVAHSCYHGSTSQTAVIAGMLALHGLRGTWRNDIHLYVTPTEFARQKFIDGGFASDRVAVKPNFIDLDAPDRTGPGDFMLYAGRLEEHKGVGLMLEAWRRSASSVPLRIIGDGPMASDVEAAASAQPAIEYLGRRPHEAVLEQMRAARALVFPSTWYETFGLTIVEAFASGLPVIASDLGPMGAELVRDGQNGLLFRPGDADHLASRVAFAWSNPEAMARMSLQARAAYEQKYTASANYHQLVALYERAMEVAAAERGHAVAPSTGLARR